MNPSRQTTPKQSLKNAVKETASKDEALHLSHKKTKKAHGLLFRIFRMCAITGFCLVLLVVAINVYMMLLTRDYILTSADARHLDADCVMVLGAGLRRDGKPSAMLADRLRVGIDVYNAGAAEKLLMSGDHGRTHYDEVNAMKAFALEYGIPSPDIFMDHAGFSTYESMYRARDIFQVKKIVIVTQHYHLYRAIYNARQMGLEAYGIPSDLRAYARQPYFDFRESMARVKDFLWGIFQPAPTYLGAAIPITGDGDLTNDQ